MLVFQASIRGARVLRPRPLLTASVALTLAACASGETVPTGDDTSTSSGPQTVAVGSGGGGASSVGSGGGGGGAIGSGGAGGGLTGTGGGKNDCGNAMVDPGEDCDGAALGGATCASIGQGFVGGTLACDSSCAFDVGACTAPPDCGNGMLDAGEACDGTNLGGQTCGTQGLGVGTLTCSGGCTFDTTQCHVCGNNTLEGPEVCDGANLGGQTCQTRGHDGGTLGCAAGCVAFDEGACSDCGDGMIESPEQCDGANLNGQTCQTQGFSGGTLSCSAACAFNLAACTGQTCGNNLREGTEVCDGTALNGQTCVTQGFANGGTLACAAGCMGYVTSGCVGAACSDGLDNDGDGFTDYPADPGCTSASDNDEGLYATSCNGVGGPVYDITFADTTQDIVVTGSTVGGTNAYAPTDFGDDCSSATGPEVVLFYRNFTQKSPVYISTDNPGTNFDTVLYIRQSSCAPTATELCNDDVFFIGGPSELAVNLPPGDFYIIVDGFNGEAGNFELTIDLP